MKKFNLALLLLFVSISIALGQSIQQEKMKPLSFLIGDWVGTSTTYSNDTIVRQVPAFEAFNYKLDKSIITIDLHSTSLQLYTIISYDPADETYYYQPYSKNGSRKLTADFKDGKFIVKASEEKRFIFTLTDEGHFHEYGEQLENGRWVKYFEDVLQRVP